MQLLAASCDRIGPLVDRPVVLNVLPGATLITAPIGTGKSFLLFDGPLFGLYKLQSRPILNRLANRGMVRVVFADSGEQLWAIQRVIKRANGGSESIQTRIFSVQMDLAQWQIFALQQRGDEVIILDGKLEEVLVPHLTEQVCGSQRETDQAILDLLPPKEVVLSRNFLLQEADSIFDLTPVERVQIFKHLFGLLGIDEAKEILLEARRNTQASLKTMQDMSVWDKKLHTHIDQIVLAKKQCKSVISQLPVATFPLGESYLSQVFLADLDLISDDVRMRGDVLNGYDTSLAGQCVARLDTQSTAYLEQQGRQHVYQSQLQELALRQKQMQQQLVTAQSTVQSLQTQLSHIDTKQLEQLAQQKSSIEAEHTALRKQIDTLLQEFTPPVSLNEAISLIEQRKQAGSLLKQQRDNYIAQQQQTEEQMRIIEQQLTHISQQAAQLQQHIATDSSFYCEKIGTDCPYIQAIKGSAISTLQEQYEAVQAQLKLLTERKQELIEKNKIHLQDIETANTKIEELKTRFTKIKFQAIEASAQALLELQQRSELAQRSYLQALEQHQGAQAILQQQAQAEGARIQLKQSLQELEQQRLQLNQQLVASSQTALLTKDQIDALKQPITDIADQVQRIAQLVIEWTDAQTQLKILEQRDVMLKQLADVFSKELMYVVLDEFLPQLQSLLNYYLAEMVDYTVHFELPHMSDDKMELQIEVRDAKGARPVKSLSGGQKSILKFAWIMSVTALFKAKFVFLDETMNSLDATTIGAVAKVLQDALVAQEMPFYCVTHAPQIQSLPFWKRHIALTLPNIDK